MNPSTPVRVVGKDGLRGTLETESGPPAGREGEVVLRLEDGRRVLVPRDALEKRSDGTCFLPLSLAELGAAKVGPQTVEQLVVPLVEEQLEARKRQVETGRLRVRKVVHEHDELIDEPLLHEELEVERVPVNRPVDAPTPVRYEGDTMIVPLFEEVLVVEKRLMLAEELHITKRRTQVRKSQQVTLRGEEATVERLPAAEPEEDRPTST